MLGETVAATTRCAAPPANVPLGGRLQIFRFSAATIASAAVWMVETLVAFMSPVVPLYAPSTRFVRNVLPLIRLCSPTSAVPQDTYVPQPTGPTGEPVAVMENGVSLYVPTICPEAASSASPEAGRVQVSELPNCALMALKNVESSLESEEVESQ